MEFMSQFDAKIVYIKRDDNCVADALSHLPVATSNNAAIYLTRLLYGFCPDDDNEEQTTIATILPARKNCPLLSAHALAETDITTCHAMTTVLSISQDPKLCATITRGYKTDPWCKKLKAAALGMPAIHKKDSLLFIGEQLVIPAIGNIQESLFCLAHDSLRHFGLEKSYGSL
jgi:hypothetical protein